MVRFLSIISTACLVFAVILALIDAERFALSWILLLLIAIPIGIFLALRRGFMTAREVVGAARSFVTGDVQHARIAEVGEPEGFFTPSSNLVLELEGEDGAIHRFNREVPVPFPAALVYRLSRRFKLPFVGRKPLTEMMAVELRREGLDIDLNWRPPPGAEIIDGPVEAA